MVPVSFEELQPPGTFNAGSPGFNLLAQTRGLLAYTRALFSPT